MGTEGIWGSHGVQGGRRRDQLSPTEYKGGGGGLKLTANQMGIIKIFIGGGGRNQVNFVVTKPKFTSPFQKVNNNQSPRDLCTDILTLVAGI